MGVMTAFPRPAAMVFATSRRLHRPIVATPRQVLSSTEADDRAFVTPDGRLMALADWSSGDVGLLDLATKKLHRLMAKPGQWEIRDDFASMRGVPSPDLGQVAFLWYSGGRNPDLRVIANREGAKPRTLVHNPEFAYVLPQAWSRAGQSTPAGDSILVVLWKHDYTAQIAWVSAADGSIKVLRSLDWRRPGRISLSPDGRYIAYSCLTGPDSVDSHIYVLASDGSGESELVKDPGVNESPTWTPDGTHLLFVSDRSASMDLWSIPVAAGKSNRPATRIQPNIGRITPLGLTRSGSLLRVKEHGTENGGGRDARGRERESLRAARSFSPDELGRPQSRTRVVPRRPLRRLQAPQRYQPRRIRPGGARTHSLERKRPTATILSPAAPLRPTWFPDGLSLLTAMTDNLNRISFHRVDLKTGEFFEAVAGDRADLWPSRRCLRTPRPCILPRATTPTKSTGGILAVDLISGEQKPPYLTTPGFVEQLRAQPRRSHAGPSPAACPTTADGKGVFRWCLPQVAPKAKLPATSTPPDESSHPR